MTDAAAHATRRRRDVVEVFMGPMVRIAARPGVGLPAACSVAHVHPGMYEN